MVDRRNNLRKVVARVFKLEGSVCRLGKLFRCWDCTMRYSSRAGLKASTNKGEDWKLTCAPYLGTYKYITIT